MYGGAKGLVVWYYDLLAHAQHLLLGLGAVLQQRDRCELLPHVRHLYTTSRDL
jgi:hypothetical protein